MRDPFYEQQLLPAVVDKQMTRVIQSLFFNYLKKQTMSEQNETWGQLAPFEAYGRAGDRKEDYISLDYAVSKSDYKDSMHGSHAMIYAKDKTVLWNMYTIKAAILVKYRSVPVLC